MMRNLFDRLSPKTIRAIYGAVAAVVVLLGAANIHQLMVLRVIGNDQCRWVVVEKGASKLLITDIVKGGVVEQAGIRDGDHLIKINGQEFRSDQQAQGLINQVAGGHARYTVEREGRQTGRL
ncbi:MAG: PDZ domain-containing protein [Bacteroidota bacterium]